jgi:hypothetical protein
MLSLGGCKGATPSDAANKMLSDFKDSFDYHDIVEEDTNSENYVDAAVVASTKLLADFDYKILDEKISDDTATVRVEITTYPFGDVFKDSTDDFFAEIVAQLVESQVGDDTSESEADAEATAEVDIEKGEYSTMFTSIFEKHLANISKNYKEEINLTLTKEKNKWRVDKLESIGSEINALYGNLVKAVEGFEAALADPTYMDQYFDENLTIASDDSEE